MNLIYVKRRERDALTAARGLGEFGAEIALIAIRDDSSNLAHLGKIYYFEHAGGDRLTAVRMAQVVASIERVKPVALTMNKPPTPYSLWIVK